MTKSIFSPIRHAFLTLALGCSVLAGSAPAFALDEAETKQVEQIIRDYLLKNPELMIEVQQALEVKQQEIAKQQATAALQQNAEKIFASPHQAVIGNPEGDVTVVEFFDYSGPVQQLVHHHSSSPVGDCLYGSLGHAIW